MSVAAAVALLAGVSLLACGFVLVYAALWPAWSPPFGLASSTATQTHSLGWRERARRSGFGPLIPILAWNLVFASRLPPLFTADAGVPPSVLTLELLGRVFVFVLPVVLVLDLDGPRGRGGLALYVIGALAYFASWLPPLLDPRPTWLWLGPYLLPAAFFVGLGMMARSRSYILGASIFVAAHLTHGVFVLAGS